MSGPASEAPRPVGVGATQRDVAELAGVSPITVSRTLAGGKYVRPDVQARVLAAARELEYLPNESARTLRPGQASGLIGVAITSLSNPYYGRFALGVEEVAAVHGRFILLGSTGESAAREAELVANFIGRRVEGLVVVPAGEPSDQAWVRRLGPIPMVAAAREMAHAEVDTALVDDESAAYDVVRDLLAEGRRRFAFIGNIQSVSAHRRRFEGLIQALEEAQWSIESRFVCGVFDEVADARAATRRFLDAAEPPQVILCANNRIAVGVLEAIAEAVQAFASPSELPGIVCFDELELASLMPVSVRIVAHDPRMVGRAAARMLFDRLDGEYSGGARRFIIPFAEMRSEDLAKR